KKPVALHFKTIKGYGVEKTMSSSSGGHGFPLKDPSELRAFLDEVYQGQTLPPEFMAWCEEMEETGKGKAKSSSKSPVVKEKVQVGVAKALIKKRKEGLPVFSVSSDLAGSTGLGD